MKEEHMEAQHDTDGGHDRAARRRELKKAFHKAAVVYFRVRADYRATGALSALRAADDAYKAWKNAH